MSTITFNLSWLCMPIYIRIILIFAVFGMRSRLRYAKRIKDAQSRGAFNDMSNPDQNSRFRWLALTALVGVLGAIASIGILLLRLLGIYLLPLEIVLIAFGIFGALGAIAGMLIQREIERRL